MSVAISWANKKQLAKCAYMVGFPMFSHIYGVRGFVSYPSYAVYIVSMSGWEGGGVGGGGGWEAGGRLHRPTGLFGVAMSPRSASHRTRHDWRALRDVSPTQG